MTSYACVLFLNRLSEICHWKILLLEAWGEDTQIADVPAYKTYAQSAAFLILWPHWTQPEPRTCGGAPCFWPGGKVLGFTSAINTLHYARGFKQDYGNWHSLGNYGWNWSWVLCYFKKSENTRNLDPIYARDIKYHSTGEYQDVQTFSYQDKSIYSVLRTYKELGYNNTDYNGPHPTGIFLMEGTLKGGIRVRTTPSSKQSVAIERTYILWLVLGSPSSLLTTVRGLQCRICTRSRSCSKRESVCWQGGNSQRRCPFFTSNPHAVWYISSRNTKQLRNRGYQKLHSGL